MSTHTESDRILKKMMRENPVATVSLVIVVLATVVSLGLLAYCGATGAAHQPQPTPFAEVMGIHGDFRIDGEEAHGVYVVVGTHDPQRYIKALQDALELIEKTGGRKVTHLDISGCPARAFFTLEDHELGRPMLLHQFRTLRQGAFLFINQFNQHFFASLFFCNRNIVFHFFCRGAGSG